MTEDDIDVRSSFRLEYIEQATKLAKLGATDNELADFFDVAVRVLHRWKVRYPEFFEALKVGKGDADARVVRSLYQRAVGYTIETEKVFCNTKGDVTRVPTVEHIQPSDTAAIFWLKNRDRDNWRDKQEHEHTGKDGAAIQAEVTVKAVLAAMDKVADEC